MRVEKSSFRYRNECLGHLGQLEVYRDVDEGSHQADEEAVQTGYEVALVEIFLETLKVIFTQIFTEICQTRF